MHRLCCSVDLVSFAIEKNFPSPLSRDLQHLQVEGGGKKKGIYLQMQVDRHINKIGLKDCNLAVKLYCYI